MYYNFKCESCNKVQEVEIRLTTLQKLRGVNLKRVLEWQGIAMGGGDGWYGKKGGTTI